MVLFNNYYPLEIFEFYLQIDPWHIYGDPLSTGLTALSLLTIQSIFYHLLYLNHYSNHQFIIYLSQTHFQNSNLAKFLENMHFFVLQQILFKKIINVKNKFELIFF